MRVKWFGGSVENRSHLRRGGISLFHIGVLAICALSTLAAPLHAAAARPQVLILASYHHGKAWTDTIVGAIRDTVTSASPGTKVLIEYMDMIRNEPRHVVPHLEFLYDSKYGNAPLTVIVAVNDEALNFLVSRRNRLFENVPIVFATSTH